MKTLKINFDCLEGYYELFIKFNNSNVEYATSTNIHALDNKEGELEILDFEKTLEEVGIEKWNKEYLPENDGIEDAVKWQVKYQVNDDAYLTKGEESFYPYTYSRLMELLKLIDDKLEYFD